MINYHFHWAEIVLWTLGSGVVGSLVTGWLMSPPSPCQWDDY
jgi:hypothetical protein